MAGVTFRKGAGYSIEAVLAAVILFTFAFGAVQSPEGRDWSRFQNELAVRDLTFMIKKTGDLDTFLRNSNTGGIRTEVSEISGRDLQVSGTVRNLPLNEMQIAFHQMPGEIHENGTEPVETGDRCYGDLVSLDANSEEPILRTIPSQNLASKYQTYLYFGDTDARQPTGYNGEEDYDTVWVDNGTKCVFDPSEGPYRLNEIFLWGNSTDPVAKHFEFKRFNNSEKTFTVYEAEKAFKIKKAMNRPLNGIETDTSVDTVNFSTSNLEMYDVLVFQENKTLSRISSHGSRLRNLVTNTSVLFMMNLSRNDIQNSNFLQDIGFKWTPMDYSVPGEYQATFSNYGTSEEIESYFLGLAGDKRGISLGPGGSVISNQGSSETSRNDVLFARNIQYNADDLDGVRSSGWSSTSGPTSCGDDYQAQFSVPDQDYSSTPVTVKNIDVGDSCNLRGVKLNTDGDPELEGPFLEDEIFTLYGRRYSPSISGPTSARLEFAGSKKIELVNHREVLENLEGKRAARIAYEENFESQDIRVIASTLYWLRGDTVNFESTEQPSSLATTAIGGVRERIFLPYRMDLRWSQ
ncbi:MAG: hypothetical protein ABEK10_02325 [Candidatus Nanosalina sp.]